MYATQILGEVRTRVIILKANNIHVGSWKKWKVWKWKVKRNVKNSNIYGELRGNL